WCHLDRTQDTETVHFIECLSFFEMEVRVGDRTGPRLRLELPRDVEYAVHGNWLAVQRRTSWTVGGTAYAQDTLLGTRLSSLIEGRTEFQVLFSPTERRSLQSFQWAGQKLLLSILDELRPAFEIIDPERSWATSKIGGLPEIGVASVWPLDI